ncbi:MAG: AAA family ATPase [Segniliparus sp.]|uniref:AAA family ATPase n=1 Tax=Segniliparus sp. TaxID=2804064 RepID=UPI003F30D333
MKLVNYRGVAGREVVFAPEGTTVVEGPNEAGKSSMIEALDLLLEVKDSSKTKQVRAVAPKGSDSAPFVEAEVESGPYRFVYAKQWLKRPATTLDVLAPKREQLTGEAAHERVQSMLAATVDLELWKALRMLQTARGQADVDGCPALLKALDAAAGPVTLSGTETTLLARIEAEVRRYHTPGGRPTGELRAAQERAAGAQTRHTAAREALESVETDSQRHDELAAQLAALRVEREEAAGALGRARERWESVRGLDGHLDLAKERAALAQAQAQAAAKEQADRQRLAAEHDERAKAVEGLVAQGGRLMAGFVATAEEMVVEQTARLERKRAELSQLRALSGQSAEAVEAQRRARAALSGAIDPQLAKRAQEAARKAEVAQAQALAVSAAVDIGFHAAQRIEVDGEPLEADAGASVRRAVLRPLDIVVPGLLTVRITPGEQGEGIEARLRQAQEALAEALGRAGAQSAEEAERRLEERALLAEELERRTLALTALLGSRTQEDLDGQVRALGAEIDSAADPGAQPAEWLQAKTREVQERESAAKAELERIADRLAQARAQEADEPLRERARQFEAAADQSRGALAELRARVAEADLGAARTEVATAEQRDEALAKRFDSVRDEAAQTAGRLSVGARAGHQETFDATGAELAHAQEELDRVAERARAAQLLWETVNARRDAAQSRYAAPLERAVNELGAAVFGDSFAVQLDGQLRVDTRTLRGTTVDFDSLSEGAKEQVSMLVRLACAKLVDPLEGAPVVIDDALGHSDPQRLAKMRDALAATTGQVIVLTCFPERFANIGKTIRL